MQNLFSECTAGDKGRKSNEKDLLQHEIIHLGLNKKITRMYADKEHVE